MYFLFFFFSLQNKTNVMVDSNENMITWTLVLLLAH